MLLTDIARRCNVSVQAVSLLLKSMAYREQVHVFHVSIPWRGIPSEGNTQEEPQETDHSKKSQ